MTSPSSPTSRENPTSSRRQARAEATARAQRQKRLVTLLAAVLVIAVAGATIFAIISSRQDSGPGPLTSRMALDSIPQSGMTIGLDNAPVTVVEYADFQCPFCANFALKIEPDLITKYVATGQVRIEFQPMPILSSLPLDDPTNESVRAAEAGYCAADQGKFWDFYSLLFSKQTGENVGNFTLTNLAAYAHEGGLDVTTFTTCMNNRTHLQEVVNSRQKGADTGVSGTPTFLVNGTRILGYGGLEAAIQDALNAGS